MLLTLMVTWLLFSPALAVLASGQQDIPAFLC